MSKNNKNGNNELSTAKILFVAAVIQLITTVIGFIEKLL
jgi:hypothetical protein